MKTNRVLMVLVGLTLLMQLGILYRQYAGPGARPARQPPVRDAPADSTMAITGLPVRGDQSARVVLVEFSDYECPFCERYASGVGKEVDKKFVEPGRVQHAFVNNPLAMHPNAKLLATAAICAGTQGRYWEMHDGIFSKKPKTVEDILPIAKDVGLNVKDLQNCLGDAKEPVKRIDADMETAKRFNLTGTPAFAIGLLDAAGQIRIEKFITGAQPFDVFDKTLREVLQKADPS